MKQYNSYRHGVIPIVKGFNNVKDTLLNYAINSLQRLYANGVNWKFHWIMDF